MGNVEEVQSEESVSSKEIHQVIFQIAGVWMVFLIVIFFLYNIMKSNKKR